MRPPSPSIPEKQFVLSALKESLRIDGRHPLERRTPTLSFGPDLGWVECELGQTRVLAYVEGKMVRPPPERPFEGMITIHSELSPMTAPEYELGRPSEEEVRLSRMLDRLVRRSDAIDKESLCVLAGQRVWHIRLTLHCLSDAGNLLDCACLASMVALKHFRRPEVEVIGDEVIIHPPAERAPVPLAINHIPYCFTFAFFEHKSQESESASTSSILDPVLLEQQLCRGVMSIALNSQKEICVLQKLGGVLLFADQILNLVSVAVEQVKELDQFVESELKKDWAQRTVEFR
ncbi:ribosomal protein S5 domain 2-like protein [Fistulina hepatica ATCC 64428]|nr:ribosomal protein S5 domain 2-like protein [Fistulina hepatica ATCC 64428]